MKRKLLSAIVAVLSGTTVVQAQSQLTVTPIVSSENTFWVTSTLITGKKDAVLIDAQFLVPEAQKVVAAIKSSGKQLTTVYITHWHPDHIFGSAVIKQAFPDAKFVALQPTVDDIKEKWEAKEKEWKQVFGDNLSTEVVIPEVLQENTIQLEGKKLAIYGAVQGDDTHNSYVYIPSIRTVVAGDIAYNGVFPWTRETNKAQRQEWIKTINTIQALHPAVVVAGHKNPALKDDPAILAFMKDYLAFYDEALATSGTAEELETKIKNRFPGLGVPMILQLAAGAAFAGK
jgi:glyoxylase-like metal-dependent hydrolase (beta-lactamase superfamily II)